VSGRSCSWSCWSRQGRTIGELIVRLRPRRSTTARGVLWRWAAGIGGYLLRRAPSADGLDLLASALAVASVVMVFRTSQHRGLAYRLSRWELEDDRGVPDQVPAAAGADKAPDNA